MNIADFPIEALPSPASMGNTQEADGLDRAIALHGVTAQTIADLRRALPFLDADSRDSWINTGLALKSLCGTPFDAEAFDLWHAFSAQAPDKYSPAEVDERWETFEPRDITYRSIFARAKAAAPGWNKSDAAPVARFTLIEDDEYCEGPAPSWLVAGVLPEAQLGVAFGEPKSGKSFFVLDLVAAVARGVPWRSLKVKQGRVVYVAAEGAGGFRKRIKAYRQHNQVPNGPMGIRILPAAPNLTKQSDTNELIGAIQRTGPCSLIVLDTLARVSPGADENSAEGMGKVLASCERIHEATGAMVLLIHHAGKTAGRGPRGWSGLGGAVDIDIEIVRADRDRVATVRNSKDGEDGAEFGFRLLTVPVGLDDDGAVVSSCVVEHVGTLTKAGLKREVKGSNEKLVWQAARDLQGLDGSAPTAGDVIEEAMSHTTAPDACTKDNRRGNLLRALNSLHGTKRLTILNGRVSVPSTD